MDKLLLKYTKEEIDEKLDEIENWKLNRNYKDLYRLVNNWLKREYGKRDKPINKSSYSEVHKQMMKELGNDIK